ncbi:uncharacterized protein P174DRAFT_489344, partial [Aspergillus novofumigatus IBT 16806]
GDVSGEELPPVVQYAGCVSAGVPRQEKVLVSCEDGEVEFGEGERMNRWTLWHRRPWIETPDTVVEEWDEIQSETEGEGEGEGRRRRRRRDIWVIVRRWMKMKMTKKMKRMRMKSFVRTAPLPSTRSNPRTKPKPRSGEEATLPLSVTWRTAARWPR